MTALIERTELEAAIRAGQVTLVDALGATYYTQRHLPGALNLVADEVVERASTLLPDKDAAIVTYCANRACPNSQQVATKLERLGYTNVRKYADGIEDWVAGGLPTETGAPATV